MTDDANDDETDERLFPPRASIISDDGPDERLLAINLITKEAIEAIAALRKPSDHDPVRMKETMAIVKLLGVQVDRTNRSLSKIADGLQAIAKAIEGQPK